MNLENSKLEINEINQQKLAFTKIRRSYEEFI